MRTLLRWFLRLVFVAVLGLGLLLGFVYPWAGGTGSFEIGRWRAYDQIGGFQPIEILLPVDQEQIIVQALLSAPHRVDDTGSLSVMTLTVASGGRTELAHYFSLDGVEGQQSSPQLPARLYTLEAGVLQHLRQEPYLFTFGPGDGEIDMTSVDLILIGGTRDVDEAIPPVGYGFTAVGLIGLLLTFRRRRQENPNSQPPPKWGR